MVKVLLFFCCDLVDPTAGQHNDSRMNTALIMTAVTLGAVVANYCEATELHKDSTGRLNGARVRDALTGEEWNVRAKVIPFLLISNLALL